MFRGLCFFSHSRWRAMRKPDAVSVAASKTVLANYRGDAPAGLVCLALVLALVALASRIAAVW